MPNVGPLERLILIVPLWILPSYLVAKDAERKGQSFAIFMFIGLIVGWFITGIAALIIRDPRPSSPE